MAMVYKLYYAEFSASMGVRVLLEEIGAPYELLWMSIDRTVERDPEFLKYNPNGWVPVLLWEGESIFECGAITTFLCDRHPEAGLAPAVDDPKRGRFLQWLFFFSSSIQNAFQMTYYPDRFVDSAEIHINAQKRSATRLKELWQVLDDAIGSNPWVLGDKMSAVDIYMFMISTWLREKHDHPMPSQFSNVHRICERMIERPSVQLVYATYIDERVETSS